jgi:integration host factor subunit alpha
MLSYQGSIGVAHMDASKTVTRNDLYDTVHRKVGLSLRESADLTESVLNEISDCIVRGETVKLSGFGTFTVRKKGQRIGRNPKTGVEAIIKPRRVLAFKASRLMKTQMNATRLVSDVQRDQANANPDSNSE